MNGVPTGFGARVRDTRSQLGLSQRELGREAGVHYATIGKIETGTRDTSPGAELVAKLAAALRVDAAWLLTGEQSGPVGLQRDPRIDAIGRRRGAGRRDIDRVQAIRAYCGAPMGDEQIAAELEAQHRARLYVEMVSPTAAHVEQSPVRLMR